MENEVLQEAAERLIHEAPAHERFAFIRGLRDRFTVKSLCRILVTDRSNYYLWSRGQARRDQRERDERGLVELIMEIHTAHPGYGAERITRELKRQGFEVGRRRVARLMREHGIAGIARRKRRNLIKPDQAAAMVPDLIRREFTAPTAGLKLVGDITCFPTSEGWLYVATVLDLCTKELIGYAIAPHMRASLAVEAITVAHRAGLVAGNAIMHTDRGSQYHATSYRDALGRLEIRQSTSRTGSCLDGAAAESSPPSRRRSASDSGATAPAPAATSRTGSSPTTNGGCIPHSGTGPRPKRVAPGRNACQPQHKPTMCSEPCPLN